tara:strand:- start:103 stop:711 length:609 start_codon:yes stop_codon:yes gene_type:complete
MADLKLDGLTVASSSNNAVSWGSGVPAGTVIQTQFRAFDGVQAIGDGSSTGQVFTNVGYQVSGQEFSIPMSVSSGNIIFGTGLVHLVSHSASGPADVVRYAALKLFADSTQIAAGAATGDNKSLVTTVPSVEGAPNEQYLLHAAQFSFTYTPPSTNSITYTVKAANLYGGNYTTLINRPTTEANADYTARGYSHFMIMEIQQ